MFYSIVETATVNGLILSNYMVKCIKELAKVELDIDALLTLELSKNNNNRHVGSWGYYLSFMPVV